MLWFGTSWYFILGSEKLCQGSHYRLECLSAFVENLKRFINNIFCFLCWLYWVCSYSIVASLNLKRKWTCLKSDSFDAFGRNLPFSNPADSRCVLLIGITCLCVCVFLRERDWLTEWLIFVKLYNKMQSINFNTYLMMPVKTVIPVLEDEEHQGIFCWTFEDVSGHLPTSLLPLFLGSSGFPKHHQHVLDETYEAEQGE